MKLEQILKLAVKRGASDIILKIGSVPRFRHNGELISLSDGIALTPELMREWQAVMMPPRLLNTFETKGECDFAYTGSGTRFRVNLFKQRGSLGMVLRVVSNFIKSIDELQLPAVINNAANYKRGLVLVTGATGSGKSTTLAAIVQAVNTTRAAHIITVEDPIEYYYTDQLSTIEQREIGEDTNSFSEALRASLRQNPDIILVGELRDRDATQTALMAAETGHMVLSTMHTQDAVDSLTRLMSYFPPDQHQSIRLQLSACLNMIVSQRLVPRADAKGRVVACEVLVANSLVREVILKGEDFVAVEEAIRKGKNSYGMQSFDQSLLTLLQSGIITEEQAINEASSRENMRLMISGING